ncbi:MAG: hypothetical protein Q8O62_09910 [Aequorivita sp.]|nr:hypothetical protein [Aequorivita sp.]
MYKGSFITDTFSLDKSTINMKDWVEPTLYNTGATTVYLNGIAIGPGDSFILGPSGVEMSGTINLNFSEDSILKNEVKVSYALLIKTCPTTPR